MKSTTNYQLVKQELTDAADITQISTNWDKIDNALKDLQDSKFNANGGTIGGAVTVSTGGITVSGGTKSDSLQVTGNETVGGTLTVTGKTTVNGGIEVTNVAKVNSLEVTGNGTVGGTFTVTGKLTANGSIEIKGSQVVSGDGTFNTVKAQAVTLTNAMPIRSQVAVKKGVNPNALTYSHWSIFDNQGYEISTSRLARFQYSVDTNGTAALAMYVNKFNSVGDNDLNGIIIQYGTDGTARVSLTHHPVENSNDKQIATTYWVRNLKATTSQYGLVKVADETALLSESDEAALTVDKGYELNDFRRMSTTYALGDKVNCAFNFGVFLECTQAGTTSDTTLDTRNVTHGQVITDGTIQWTVRTHVKSVNGNVPNANGDIEISVQSFPSGTQLLFYQDSAPTGWTKVTGIGNRAVKIVEDDTGGSTGGSNNFSDVFKSLNTSSVSTGGTVGHTTITTNTMPAHRHGVVNSDASAGNFTSTYVNLNYNDHSTNDDGPWSRQSGSTGGNASHNHTFSGSSHSHTVNLSVKYINVIVCKKD